MANGEVKIVFNWPYGTRTINACQVPRVGETVHLPEWVGKVFKVAYVYSKYDGWEVVEVWLE